MSLVSRESNLGPSAIGAGKANQDLVAVGGKRVGVSKLLSRMDRFLLANQLGQFQSLLRGRRRLSIVVIDHIVFAARD